MNKVSLMLKELRSEITKIIFLDSFLNSAIIFLIFYMALILINVNSFYAFIPFIIGFIFFYIDKKKKHP